MLSKLSTELDSKIADFLVGDTKALGAFSRVNKYYRLITEPYLYKDLTFHVEEYVPLVRLLLTLLHRKELALHISSAQLHENGESLPVTEAKRTSLSDDLRASRKAIFVKLLDVTTKAHGSTEARQITLHWITQLLQNHPSAIDEVLALVLCMATNLQRFDVDVSGWRRFTRTPQILMMPWKGADAYPFKKVTDVSIGGLYGTGYEVALLPSVVALTVQGTGADRIPFRQLGHFTVPTSGQPFLYPALQPTNPSLRTLTFFGLHNITSLFLAQIVSSPWLANLKKLAVQHCGDNDSRVPGAYDLPALLRALEQHVPNLEVFEFRRIIYDHQAPSLFDTFKGLPQLRDLSVDLESLVSYQDDQLKALSEPHRLFPESLQNLTLDSICTWKVSQQSRTFHNNIGEVDNLGEAVSQALRQLAAKFALKRLVLVMVMQGVDEDGPYPLELAPEDVVFFRYAADELLKIGLRLEVHRAPNSFCSSYELLVKPGWTKRLPHATPHLQEVDGGH